MVSRGGAAVTLLFLFFGCGSTAVRTAPRVDPTLDTDGDRIPDLRDRCPRDPEDEDGFEDTDGCPEVDNDRDGIADVDDLCPNQWEDCDGFEDTDGCPDPDNDRDRIPDACDSCPNDPETYNGWEDGDGCPDHGYVIVEESQIVILEHIYFRKNEPDVQPASIPIIDAVAATLQGNPQLTQIAIIGHAEESEHHAHRIAQLRAEAVRDALVQRGVDPARIVVHEAGNARPVDPRHTVDARERNRRAEFFIVSTVDGPMFQWNGTDMVSVLPPPVSGVAHGPPHVVDPTPNIQPACANGVVPESARPPPGGCPTLDGGHAPSP